MRHLHGLPLHPVLCLASMHCIGALLDLSIEPQHAALHQLIPYAITTCMHTCMHTLFYCKRTSEAPAPVQPTLLPH